MRLALADIEPEPLRALEQELADRGSDVVADVVDVSRAEDIDRLATVAFERFGAVHVLCNNAGVVKRARSWALTRMTGGGCSASTCGAWSTLCGRSSLGCWRSGSPATS